MRRINVFSYDGVRLDVDKIELLEDPRYAGQLALIQNSQEDFGIYEYVSDLDEYRGTRVKKLYIKGFSNKKVPRQVLNIETQTFTTKPSKYIEKYNVRFEEF